MENASSASRPVKGLAWAIICFLLLPIAVVFPVSLTDKRYLSLPEDEISWQHFAHLFSSPEWLSSIGQSFIIACAATVLCVAAGTLCAIGCWRLGSKLADFVRVLMLVPIIVPTIVYALGIYRLWVDLRLLDTYAGLVIAHAVTGIPYVVIIVSTALAHFDARLEQAARNLGANLRQRLMLVILPGILPAVVSSAIFAFIHSWDELVLALFLASRAVFTLPRRIWDGINEQLDPTMAAVAVLLIFVTAALLTLDLWLRGRRAG
ncbi:ABC transporter, permease protein [Acetobacteraceae bacterium AT-5844]|nr:ABC transporter, permease protein [Acetobacteraceae bacterium AT-5844]